MAIHTFIVEGTGLFPFDMLRYDACWPASSEDASNIAADYGEPPLKRRQVTLATDNRAAPTTARWYSFNWRVV